MVVGVDHTGTISDLPNFVRRHAWAWLFEMARRLQFDVYLVDRRGVPTLWDPTKPPGLPDDVAFKTIVSRTQQSTSVETFRLGMALVACLALRPNGEPIGSLVVIRHLSAGTDVSGEARRDLERMVSWLHGSVEAQLAAIEPAAGTDAQRLGALRRALLEVTGSDPELLCVFGQAAAIWEDVHVESYREGLDGNYLRYSPSIGTAANVLPDVLPRAAGAQSRGLSRLSWQHLEQLGLSTSDDLVTARIEAPSDSPWLLVLSGQIDQGVMTRLSLYSDTLEEILWVRSLTAHLAFVRALSARLLAVDETPIQRAGHVLDQIQQAVDASAGAMAIALPRGGHLLAVGTPSLLASTNGSAPPRLEVTRALQNGATLVLAVGRSPEAPPFGSRERGILESAVELIEPWATENARHAVAASERRAVPRPFEQVVERAAAQAVQQGDSVSVLVIRFNPASLKPGLTERLAAQIRAHLRATEPAGALTEGEIAALLFDSGPEQAHAVMRRLRRVASTIDDGAPLAGAAMGVAWRAGGAVYDTSLIAAARTSALNPPTSFPEDAQIQ